MDCVNARRSGVHTYSFMKFWGVKYFTFMLHADNGFQLNLPVFLIHDK